MNAHKVCPCCSNSMLRCLERDRSYWFCRHCWQEMPDLTIKIKTTFKEPVLAASQTTISSNNNIGS